jgi:hypothetical protein
VIVDAAVLKAEGDDRNCTMEISLRGEGDLVSDDGGGVLMLTVVDVSTPVAMDVQIPMVVGASTPSVM